VRQVTRSQPVGSTASAAEPTALLQIRGETTALLAEGRTEEALDYSLAALAAVLRKNTELELLLAKLRRSALGTRSERIAPEQLALLLEELHQLGAAQAERDAVQEARDDAQLDDEIRRAAAAVSEGARKPGRRGGGWRTRDVEQHVHHVEVSAAERICGRCGRARRRMGEDITRTLVYVPAQRAADPGRGAWPQEFPFCRLA
jgi:transposase